MTNFALSNTLLVVMAVGMTVLRDFLVGVVGSVTTDPSEPLQKVLIHLPLNSNKLRWLEIYAVKN
jgi:hypothetical protein